ncbi:MAG: hypothetical protein ACOYI4_02295 [Christensenellales bacterium]
MDESPAHKPRFRDGAGLFLCPSQGAGGLIAAAASGREKTWLRIGGFAGHRRLGLQGKRRFFVMGWFLHVRWNLDGAEMGRLDQSEGRPEQDGLGMGAGIWRADRQEQGRG